jgi:hypothetical protein
MDDNDGFGWFFAASFAYFSIAQYSKYATWIGDCFPQLPESHIYTVQFCIVF